LNLDKSNAMITKIICPVDFSPVAINAVEYAARLCQVFGSRLILLNAQKLKTMDATFNLREGVFTESIRRSSENASEVLNKMSVEIGIAFRIAVDYKVDVTHKSLASVVSSSVEGKAMVVMGTNGPDDLFQFFFGTNTFRVTKNENCPVFIVPHNVSYGAIKKILLTWDDKADNKKYIEIVNGILSPFDANLEFLNVSAKGLRSGSNGFGKDGFNQFRRDILPQIRPIGEVVFRHIISNDVTSAILKHMHVSEADLLCVVHHQRDWVEDMLHNSITRQLSEISDYPMIVFRD
jgi:nucleotide-binding universal stress UspA family protein